MRKMTELILDTSAFIHGYGVIYGNDHYTVPAVKTEINSSFMKMKYENSVKLGYLNEIQPEEKYTKLVKSFISKEGEEAALSLTDIQILALAVKLKSKGKSPLISLTTHGIVKKIRWMIYCPGCKRNFKVYPSNKECPVCGTKLNRKPKTKVKI
jgi:UPF0271 protein